MQAHNSDFRRLHVWHERLKLTVLRKFHVFGKECPTFSALRKVNDQVSFWFRHGRQVGRRTPGSAQSRSHSSRFWSERRRPVALHEVHLLVRKVARSPHSPSHGPSDSAKSTAQFEWQEGVARKMGYPSCSTPMRMVPSVSRPGNKKGADWIAADFMLPHP